jgi:pimeloyl-ACP methyl ester carboxylesterase
MNPLPGGASNMAMLEIGDVHLYYEVHGNGDPLLLIAGLASDSQSWQPIIGELSRHYHVIVLDNRGAGRTSSHDVDVSIPLMADDCIALINHLGLTSVSILGHSMGGFVAMDCAIRFPDCVEKLILAATSAFNSQRNNALLSDWVSYQESGMDLRLWFRNIFYWIFSRDFFENEEALNEAIRLAIEYPYPQSRLAFKKQVKAIAEFNCLQDLPHIISKTLVVCGKEDLLFPPEESILLSEKIPGARFSLIEKAAHSIYMEYPKAFTERVLSFL